MTRRVLLCLPGTIDREWVDEHSYHLKDLIDMGWVYCTHSHEEEKVAEGSASSKEIERP